MKRRLLICATAAIAISLMATTATTGTAGTTHPSSPRDGYTFAVIGDIPYGDAELATFPQAVAQINADRDVRLVAHLGDIKSGSSVCSDAYFQQIRADFDRFADPLVYTVGDNEWTDCHRPNNGGYDPLERLAAVRRTFFDHPGATLGQHPARVQSQADQGYPENVRFRRDRVSFAAIHVVGSNNSLLPWTGNTAPTPAQTAEVLGRTSAVIGEIRATFAAARRHHDRSVVLMTQADMFDPTVTAPSFADYYAFQPIVAAIAQESAAFGRPVYLLNGDSHVYEADHPLAAGSSWLDFYGVTSVSNLSRITVDGSADATNYLKVTIDPRSKDVLRWQRIPYRF